MTTLRMTNGTEVFSVTVDRHDEIGPAQAFDSRGGRYDRDDYNGGWSSDAADELVTVIADGESDEDAKARILAEQLSA
jgi:hypothetical protein